MPEPLDLAAVRARAAAARDLVTRLKLAGNITDVGGAEALYIIVGDLEATLSRLEAADRLHRADHARVADLEAALAEPCELCQPCPEHQALATGQPAQPATGGEAP